MENKSVSKNTGITPRKMKMLTDLVRGKPVNEALDILKFAASPHGRIVAKVVAAAASDAESQHQVSKDNLKIVEIYANEAPTMRRFKARSRGRASPILRRSSHITVVVGDQEV
jgi:large subunit ribosomal protein L22